MSNYDITRSKAEDLMSKVREMSKSSWKLGLRKGDRVRLGRHDKRSGMDSWESGRDTYVGRRATITKFEIGSSSKEPFVRVNLDDGAYTWYLIAILSP
jgi:hypothetical protein